MSTQVTDTGSVLHENIVISRRGSQRSKHPFQDRILQRLGDEVYETFKGRPENPHLKGMFAVCDGHGKPGHVAAEWFSRDLTSKIEQMFFKLESSSSRLDQHKLKEEFTILCALFNNKNEAY